MRFLASILLILAGVVPMAVQAQDTTPPLITAVQVGVAPDRNGDPITVTVSATADEPSQFEVTCTYASSYPRFDDAALAYWQYKTAAVGNHTGATVMPATALADLAVSVGPRCYHADTLTVAVVAIDTVGNRSEPAVAHRAAIEMPFTAPAPIPDGRTYAVGTHWLGSQQPADHNKTVIADWAKPDLILCTTGFFFEGPHTEPGWDHWVDRLRSEPGSNNVALLGFTNVSTINDSTYPVQQRLYAFIQSVYEEVDDNVLVHLVDGSLPQTVDNDPGRLLINIFNETARDTLAWFLAQEWNKSENREPRVGLMFDVYELFTDYAVNGEFAAYYIDRDRDGIPMLEDPDEIEGARLGRIEFFRSLRRHIAATSTDPNVGRYFLIGANTVSGRSDGELLAEVDFLFIEDVQCAPNAQTEYVVYDGEGCYDEHVSSFPFHFAAAEHFTREFCPGIYYENHLITSGIVPNPSDHSQAWEDLTGAMRSEAGGPFISPESQGGPSAAHPVHLEVFSLLFDHIYPIWHHHHNEDDWNRQWWHPSAEGLADLHVLGQATSPLIRDSLGEGIHYWRRQYAAGSVEVVIADTSRFECDAGDLFDFRVTAGGQVLRQSDSWGQPELETFFVAAWDTAGVGGTIRVDLTALASEPVLWERSYRLGDHGSWSTPTEGAERDATLAGSWDTGLLPRTGSLWVRVRGRDQTGLETDWAKREVSLNRFGGFGVVIEDTLVHGTAYGLPAGDGEYEIVGRGTSAPEFAPPHFLEITGSAPAGFVPVEVRWSNSLGGEGQAEGTVAWRAPAVPLHRGANVITITCIDAGGTARVGTITKIWNYPGKPGRQ